MPQSAQTIFPLDRSGVYVPHSALEGQTGGIYLESADEVARYTLVFEHLRASALSTSATVRLIDEVARDT